MSNKLLNFFINSLLITIFIFIFLYSNIVKERIMYGINIWINILIPSILPFLIISKLLINYNILDFINKVFGKIFEKLFNVSKESSFVVITSIFTGFPTGSIYVKDLLNSNTISIEEANKLITFTSYSNPLFIISGIGESMLKSKKIGLFIFVIHLITGLSLGIIFKSNNVTNNIKTNKKEKHSFINVLITSINDAFNILINILGIIIFFLIIISLIDTILPNNFFISIFKGFIEITTGTSNIAILNIPIKLKTAIIGSIISFNGICIHFQIKSIIDNTQIKYSRYLIARILHSILCFILIYLLFDFL